MVTLKRSGIGHSCPLMFFPPREFAQVGVPSGSGLSFVSTLIYRAMEYGHCTLPRFTFFQPIRSSYFVTDNVPNKTKASSKKWMSTTFPPRET
jgi:hypothetical protein